MPRPVLVTVEAVLRPEARQRLLAAVPGFVAATRAERGCLAYEFYVARTEPVRIATIERWASARAAESHMAAPHTREFLALAGECLAAPPVFTTLPL